jgi:uncharacterized protein with PIN domain
MHSTLVAQTAKSGRSAIYWRGSKWRRTRTALEEAARKLDMEA